MDLTWLQLHAIVHVVHKKWLLLCLLHRLVSWVLAESEHDCMLYKMEVGNQV